MTTRAIKYFSVFVLPLSIYLSLKSEGLATLFALAVSFVFIPLLEIILLPNAKNLETVEAELVEKDRLYDFLLYIVAFIHIYIGVLFLKEISQPNLSSIEYFGKIGAWGIMCGAVGINVAHELGHRNTKFEKTLSRILLFSTFYLHFTIEHNQGHHKKVGTPEDPASARYGENIYFFWVRTVFFSYISAWQIQLKNLKRKNQNFISLHNEMLWFQILQLAFLSVLLYFFGWLVSLAYCASALMGILLLETINYIEHYGLSRKKVSEFRYENVQPQHSWNSNHVVGRVMLFELTRHSDHHFDSHKKYQLLDHHDSAPQLPTGYPGSMLLALIPPLWFYIMHKRMDLIES